MMFLGDYEEQQIRDAGRGHLIPDYDRWVLDDDGSIIYGDEPIEDDDRDEVEARIDAGDGDE